MWHIYYRESLVHLALLAYLAYLDHLGQKERLESPDQRDPMAKE